MQEIPTAIPVVAAALVGPDGRILMHRRRLGSAHGGLWEFPGGKVEAGETNGFALIREIEEELGVRLEAEALAHVGRAGEEAGGVVIDLYSARAWSGEPCCLEGEEIAWFAVQELQNLAMPPLDVPLARALEHWLEKAK